MPAAPSRNAFIDHLRVVLTVLVILHHAAIVYGGSGSWYWKQDPETPSRLLLLFNAVNQSYFMGCFFLLAGYFTPRSFDRKGAGPYLADRFLRLGLPLLAYFLILSPLTIALAQTTRGHPFWSGWWERILNRDMEPGPLWFAEALLLFALAYAAWRAMRQTPGADLTALPSNRTLLLVALATGAASFLIRQAVPVGVNVAWLQLGYFAPYVVLFIAGCLAARHQLLERVTWPEARPWAITSAVMFFVLPVLIATRGDKGSFTGGWTLNAACYALWDPLMAWGIILTLLWSFRTYFAGSNRFTTALARSAFGAFIVHPPVLVGLSLLARPWTMPQMAKLFIVGPAACAAAFALAGLLLLVPGFKKVL
jgi:peptidoglycan/LPS O-acetylase OafA/YrhL